MSFILALDEGTTSTRAIVFNRAGAIRSEAMARAGIHARHVAAIGITNQRETTVVWDRVTSEPVCNAVVWQHSRTAGYCDWTHG